MPSLPVSTASANNSPPGEPAKKKRRVAMLQNIHPDVLNVDGGIVVTGSKEGLIKALGEARAKIMNRLDKIKKALQACSFLEIVTHVKGIESALQNMPCKQAKKALDTFLHNMEEQGKEGVLNPVTMIEWFLPVTASLSQIINAYHHLLLMRRNAQPSYPTFAEYGVLLYEIVHNDRLSREQQIAAITQVGRLRKLTDRELDKFLNHQV